MSEMMSIDLTEEQRDVLLRGLRYVRSSLMLDMRDPSPELDRQRDEQLRAIAFLTSRLGGGVAQQQPAQVS